MNLGRRKSHHPLRLRHRRTDLLRGHVRSLATLRTESAARLHLIPPGSLSQGLLVTRGVFSFSRRESPNMTHTHEDGYGSRFEDFADAGAIAALRCRAAHFVEDGFENRETGVDDAEEGFEGGEQGDESIGCLSISGNYGRCCVDAVKSESADAVESM